jgi:hypothetical protein
MKGNATSPRRLVDVRDRCKWLRLTAESERDEVFLSKLYLCLFHGGRVTLREKKEPKTKTEDRR